MGWSEADTAMRSAAPQREPPTLRCGVPHSSLSYRMQDRHYAAECRISASDFPPSPPLLMTQIYFLMTPVAVVGAYKWFYFLMTPVPDDSILPATILAVLMIWFSNRRGPLLGMGNAPWEQA